ncbi:MAG: hypothetical protein AAF514_15580, partial [Verrucomicrobiota bacterium]
MKVALLCFGWVAISAFGARGQLSFEIEPITEGPRTHFFGYIGHVGNVPWSGDDRFILALRTGFHDRMPGSGDPAEVILVDTENGNGIRVVDQSRAWNPQQGTMFYWNPEARDTQFLFNDRDPVTG